MYRSLLANLLLLISIFQFTVLAAPDKYAFVGAKLEVRQAPAPSAQCLDYEVTANLSVIGANASYRSVFMQKSQTGTILDSRMFAQAISPLLPGRGENVTASG